MDSCLKKIRANGSCQRKLIKHIRHFGGIGTASLPLSSCQDLNSERTPTHEVSKTYPPDDAFQSGALNESYSDIFGETVDLLNNADGQGGNNNAEPYPNGKRWLVGEDLGQQVQELLLRDMYDPDAWAIPASSLRSIMRAGRLTAAEFTRTLACRITPTP